MINKYFLKIIPRVLQTGLFVLFFSQVVLAQAPETQFNGFGHLDFGYRPGDSSNAYFSLGEHDMFINSKLRNNISFLGEFVIRYNENAATKFLPSIERSFLKINYKGNHNIIAGKIHSPVNYWNDVYHHGRLFFPTIERPLAFSYIIPLHTLGLQFQGQNLGNLNWGYDIVLGNGISSNDFFKSGTNLSLTAAAHFKPSPYTRIGASFYTDYLPNNFSGVHTGHNSNPAHYRGPLYKGALGFQLTSLSIAHFGNKFEFLSESSYNHTRTDTLGSAHNFASFLYAGYIIKEKHVPYFVADYLNVDKKDLYTYELETLKLAVGYKYEFNHLINIKSQLEYQHQLHGFHDHGAHNDLMFRVQLAYGF
jgi:hypothetical protein